jgi:FkbM family methyltransferase
MTASNVVNRILHHETFSRSSIASAFAREPLGLIDVGARGDIDPALTQLAGVTAVLGFEADRAEASRLQSGVPGTWASMAIEPAALSDRVGQARLYLASEPNNHSLRRPNSDFVRRYAMEKFIEVGSEPLVTTTLDHLLFDCHPREHWLGELLKIDTQGTELEILRGAARTLEQRTAAIICEIEFAPIYVGQALFADVEVWLRDKGFAFFGFSEQHARSRKFLDKRHSGGRERLLWSDALFFKDPLATGISPAGRERLGDCLIACALMVGFYDYALEIAEWTAAIRPDPRGYFCDVEAVVADLAHLDPEVARTEARSLADAANANPDLANVLVGQFVDRRRKLHDYDDVRSPSAWQPRSQTLGWKPDVG